MAKKKEQPKKEEAKEAMKAGGVLLRPIMTEKAANASGQSVYAFSVALRATKNEIAKAFAAAYKHKPLKVNTVTVSARAIERRTTRGSIRGTSKKARKAYVFLPKGTSVDIAG
jgi:large subunit ribosomal protein L23